ncbi:hypothetical protein D3C87_1263160 [compost metagenome]
MLAEIRSQKHFGANSGVPRDCEISRFSSFKQGRQVFAMDLDRTEKVLIKMEACIVRR